MNKINYNFKERTAVVTGGAQGFGFDIAKRFLESGAKVIIWDIDPKMIEKAVTKADRDAAAAFNAFRDYVDLINESEEKTRVFTADKSSTTADAASTALQNAEQKLKTVVRLLSDPSTDTESVEDNSPTAAAINQADQLEEKITEFTLKKVSFEEVLKIAKKIEPYEQEYCYPDIKMNCGGSGGKVGKSWEYCGGCWGDSVGPADWRDFGNLLNNQKINTLDYEQIRQTTMGS